MTDVYFALDLGTTKFCLAQLKVRKNRAPKIQIVSVDAQGMRRGMVSDYNPALKAIRKLVDLGETEFNTDIRSVSIGIAGSHLEAKRCTHTALLNQDHVITEKDILDQLAELKLQNNSLTQEALHCYPQSFDLDQRTGIINPVGFRGQKLKTTATTFLSDRAYLKDIIGLINNCGLRISHLFAEPIASASVSSLRTEKKLVNYALADIGGGTTDGVIYLQEKPVDIFTINIGGKVITNDLAIGLNISYEEAEKIKIFNGMISHQPESIPNHIKQTQSEVFDILAPRIAEFGNLLAKQIEPYKAFLKEGLILTGGGAGIQGLEEFLSKYLKIPVHNVKPLYQRADSEAPREFACKYATVIGLLKLQVEAQTKLIHLEKNAKMPKYFSRLIEWFKEMS